MMVNGGLCCSLSGLASVEVVRVDKCFNSATKVMKKLKETLSMCTLLRVSFSMCVVSTTSEEAANNILHK